MPLFACFLVAERHSYHAVVMPLLTNRESVASRQRPMFNVLL